MKSTNCGSRPPSSEKLPSPQGHALGRIARSHARYKRPEKCATRSQLPAPSRAPGSEHTKHIFRFPRARPRARACARLVVGWVKKLNFTRKCDAVPAHKCLAQSARKWRALVGVAGALDHPLLACAAADVHAEGRAGLQRIDRVDPGVEQHVC